MSADAEIAAGGPGDLPGFVAVLEETAAWLWGRGIRQWEPGSMRAQEPTLASWAAAGHLLVARDARAVVGGCFLVPEAGREWSGRDGTALYLHKLAVARAHARRGIARRILAHCDEVARTHGVPRLRLDCWDGNARLRAFYRDAGFRELEAVPSHGYAVRLFERAVAW